MEQTIEHPVWSKHRQYKALAVLSLCIVAMAGVSVPTSSTYFQRFFGNINPFLVIALAIIIAGICLSLLQRRGWFEIFRGRSSLRGLALSAGFATLLALAIVIADFVVPYPEDINVPLPQALLFYPVIGYVAEVVFHLLPLTLLLFGLSRFDEKLGTNRVLRLSIILTAMMEPTFQISFIGTPLSWFDAYTWLHIFTISLLQLYVFRRYDFATMFAFRLFYYAYWHILWGTLRLEVLF